jgi:diguanylate cyclase (GGDEF)-like protein
VYKVNTFAREGYALQKMAPKVGGKLRSLWWGLAAACLAAPVCRAEGPSLQQPHNWDWALVSLVAALLVVLALARRRIHRLAVQNRQGEPAVRRRIEDLERENAGLMGAAEKMRHFAEHDDLTGLWNRRVIVERLRQEVDRSRRDGTLLSVILVDLDRFKEVNDNFGHLFGDLVLKAVAAIFQHSVRTYDWVGRYGGEEFLLILPGSSFANARLRAEQFRKVVEAARIVDGVAEVQVTASFGVASGFPSNCEGLLLAADKALYAAKDNGRNCVMAREIEPPAKKG